MSKWYRTNIEVTLDLGEEEVDEDVARQRMFSELYIRLCMGKKPEMNFWMEDDGRVEECFNVI